MSDKLDSTQQSLSAAEAELAKFRARVSDLEQKLSKDQRSLLAAESQYRDQLTERNTLLLTIYQYMDKILGVDKTPVRGICSHGPSRRRKLIRASIEEEWAGGNKAVYKL